MVEHEIHHRGQYLPILAMLGVPDATVVRMDQRKKSAARRGSE